MKKNKTIYSIFKVSLVQLLLVAQVIQTDSFFVSKDLLSPSTQVDILEEVVTPVRYDLDRSVAVPSSRFSQLSYLEKLKDIPDEWKQERPEGERVARHWIDWIVQGAAPEEIDFYAVYLDFNNLKLRNWIYTNPIVDVVLYDVVDEIARIVSQVQGKVWGKIESGFIYRMGGDENVLILPTKDPRVVQDVMDQIKAYMRRELEGKYKVALLQIDGDSRGYTAGLPDEKNDDERRLVFEDQRDQKGRLLNKGFLTLVKEIPSVLELIPQGNQYYIIYETDHEDKIRKGVLDISKNFPDYDLDFKTHFFADGHFLPFGVSAVAASLKDSLRDLSRSTIEDKSEHLTWWVKRAEIVSQGMIDEGKDSFDIIPIGEPVLERAPSDRGLKREALKPQSKSRVRRESRRSGGVSGPQGRQVDGLVHRLWNIDFFKDRVFIDVDKPGFMVKLDTYYQTPGMRELAIEEEYKWKKEILLESADLTKLQILMMLSQQSEAVIVSEIEKVITTYWEDMKTEGTLLLDPLTAFKFAQTRQSVSPYKAYEMVMAELGYSELDAFNMLQIRLAISDEQMAAFLFETTPLRQDHVQQKINKLWKQHYRIIDPRLLGFNTKFCNEYYGHAGTDDLIRALLLSASDAVREVNKENFEIQELKRVQPHLKDTMVAWSEDVLLVRGPPDSLFLWFPTQVSDFADSETKKRFLKKLGEDVTNIKDLIRRKLEASAAEDLKASFVVSALAVKDTEEKRFVPKGQRDVVENAFEAAETAYRVITAQILEENANIVQSVFESLSDRRDIGTLGKAKELIRNQIKGQLAQINDENSFVEISEISDEGFIVGATIYLEYNSKVAKNGKDIKIRLAVDSQLDTLRRAFDDKKKKWTILTEQALQTGRVEINELLYVLTSLKDFEDELFKYDRVLQQLGKERIEDVYVLLTKQLKAVNEEITQITGLQFGFGKDYQREHSKVAKLFSSPTSEENRQKLQRWSQLREEKREILRFTRSLEFLQQLEHGYRLLREELETGKQLLDKLKNSPSSTERQLYAEIKRAYLTLLDLDQTVSNSFTRDGFGTIAPLFLDESFYNLADPTKPVVERAL